MSENIRKEWCKNAPLFTFFWVKSYFLKKNAFFLKKVAEKFGRTKKVCYLCIAIER